MLALAVINHLDLIHTSVQLYKEKWSPAKSQKMITSIASCIKAYNIKCIALSIPKLQYQTSLYSALKKLIIELAYENKIKVEEIKSDDIKILVPKGKKNSKKQQMEMLCYFYEDLQPLYQKEMTNKNTYYQKLFDAVGVATIAIHQ